MQELTPAKKQPPAELDAIDLGFQKTAKERAVAMADEELLKAGQILSQKALQERYENELMQEFATFRAHLKNGASKIIESLQELSVENPDLLADDVTTAFEHISGLAEIIEKDEAAFSSQDTSLQELAHVSNQTMDKLYQAARSLYQKAYYEDARDAFLFLTNITPQNHAFWLGLANCLYCLKRYEEALQAYACASSANPGDPASYFYTSRCYKELGEIDNAIEALDFAFEAVEANDEFTDWKPSLTQEKIRLAAMHHH